MKIFKLGAFLAICGALLGLSIAGVNQLTSATIAKKQLESAQASLKEAYYDANAFCSYMKVDAGKELNKQSSCKAIDKGLFTGDITAIHIAKKGSTAVGAVYQTSTKNDFGNVDMLTGITKDGAIHGWTSLSSSSQSAGYGADLLKNTWFKVYIIDQSKAPDAMKTGASSAFNGAGITRDTVTGAIKAIESHFGTNKGALGL